MSDDCLLCVAFRSRCCCCICDDADLEGGGGGGGRGAWGASVTPVSSGTAVTSSLKGQRTGVTKTTTATRLADTTDNNVEIKAGLCNADPITTQGKRIQMAQMMFIPLVPIIVLVSQIFLGLVYTIDNKVRKH